MRKALTKTLHGMLSSKKEIYLLSADLGFAAFDDLRKEYPKNFINIGVAEQSMISIATGMALAGKEVYCYSILPFAVYRPFEQIRIACYNNAPIRVIGMGVGLDYDLAGNTHFGLEDIKVMTALPNITVLSPCDEKEVEVLFQKIVSIKTPVYFRLTKNSDPELHKKHGEIVIGEPLLIKEGSSDAEITLISTGAITKVALEVAERLSKEGHSCELWHLHTLKPCKLDRLMGSLKSKKLAITIEENTGGLNGIIASEMALSNLKTRLIPFMLKDEFGHIVGKREWMLDQAGLSADKIYNKVLKEIKK